MKSLLAAAFIVLIGASGAVSQHEHGGEITGKTGEVHFPISCKPEVQEQFEKGVALLHSFWYEAAFKTFSQISTNDPQCAMAYWGIAMSLYHPLWDPPLVPDLRQGLAAIATARPLASSTEREKAYIAAIESYYGNWENLDHLSRALKYEKAMEQLYIQYPEDHEAAIFYSLAILGTALPSDKTYAKQIQAGEILEKIFELEPNHPGVAHYIIHCYDFPELASRALPAARKYAVIAPAAPHALHMPSHIFTRLGLWQESINSNLDSAAAAAAYAENNFPGLTWYEEIHALDYQLYAYLQLAQDKEAQAVLNKIKSIQKVEPTNFATSYSLAGMTARYVLERAQWQEAAKVQLEPSSFPWSDYPWAEAISCFARSLGQARSGDIASARQGLQNMKYFFQQLTDQKQIFWAGQVKILSQTVAAWIDLAEGKNDEALKFMRSSADLEDSTKHVLTLGPILPARELLGEMLLELNKPQQALNEYEKALKDAPNRLNALAGAARAAELAGKTEQARSYYVKIEESCKNATGDRPTLDHAKNFLTKQH